MGAGVLDLSALADRLLDGPVAKSELVFEVSASDKLFDPRPYVDCDKLRGQPVDPRAGLTIDLSDVAADCSRGDTPTRTSLGPARRPRSSPTTS